MADSTIFCCLTSPSTGHNRTDRCLFQSRWCSRCSYIFKVGIFLITSTHHALGSSWFRGPIILLFDYYNPSKVSLPFAMTGLPFDPLFYNCTASILSHLCLFSHGHTESIRSNFAKCFTNALMLVNIQRSIPFHFKIKMLVLDRLF